MSESLVAALPADRLRAVEDSVSRWSLRFRRKLDLDTSRRVERAAVAAGRALWSARREADLYELPVERGACPRCGGTGYYRPNAGVCFRCGGSGRA